MPKPRLFESVVIILLLFLGVVMYFVLASGTGIRFDGSGWNLTAAGPVLDIHVDDDGTLYVFSGDNDDTGNYCSMISTIRPDGFVGWQFCMPESWAAANRFFLDDRDRLCYAPYHLGGKNDPLYAIDSGQLYLYVSEYIGADPDFSLHNGTAEGYAKGDFVKEVVAITPEGTILWKTPLTDHSYDYSPMSDIYAKNGTIYVYDDFRVTAINSDGALLYTVSNITRDITVDEDNNLYVAACADVLHNPGRVVKSYYPNGSLRWKKDLGETIFVYAPNEPSEFNRVLLYHDRTLHVPTARNLYTLDDAGNILRVKDYNGLNYALFKPMPIDSRGNVYLLLNSYPPFLDVVAPNGNDRLRPISDYNVTFAGENDGIVYYVVYSSGDAAPENTSMKNLMGASITAYDSINDVNLWNYTIPLDIDEVYYTDANDGFNLIPGVPTFTTEKRDYSRVPGMGITYNHYQDRNLDWWAMGVLNRMDRFWGMRMVSGNNTVYVNYYTINREVNFYTLRHYVYSNNLYALDNNGTLLWQKALQSPITSMAVNNSTLYYGTHDGKLFAENSGLIAGGFALAAILYLFIRFFLVGTVARAKDRLNKNENRNGIVKYVEENPGSTLRDISRGLGMNIGTVRYHTLVLGINHRVSVLQADDKHVRYFPVSARYTMDDRLVMSLIRRDGMRKVLELLLERPGLSNTDLARLLNMKESAVSRYMKVLTAKGIVDRRTMPGGSLSYSINDKLLESVDRALRHGKN